MPGLGVWSCSIYLICFSHLELHLVFFPALLPPSLRRQVSWKPACLREKHAAEVGQAALSGGGTGAPRHRWLLMGALYS